MIDDPVLVFAVIGALGVGSQWLAWRLQMPAIVLMLAAGILAGPVTGMLDPKSQLGDLFSPVISVAVALILFEGGMTLNFKELGDSRNAIRRLVYIGAPLAWIFSTLVCHYVAGLDWASSAVFGGILVVTGPTVVTPLLRQAKLKQRPASVLRWEAIVVDPVGALFAVFAYEIVVVLSGEHAVGTAAAKMVLGIVVATILGYIAGRVLVRAFVQGWAPEYMKAPILLAVVLTVFALSNMVLHESGLLAVTVMGAVMGNARLPSLVELIRFKEHIAILLVSGVFILLAASLDVDSMMQLDWTAALFVLAVLFVSRPAAVMLSLIGSNLSMKERGIIAWIAPRGVVAIAIVGFFASRLQEVGHEDAKMLAPLAFLIVTATVVAHGFSIRPLSRMLGLTSSGVPGVVIIGGSPFATALGKAVAEGEAPVLIADGNWKQLRGARSEGLEVFHGEILSERFEHKIDTNRYGHLIAATDNDAYNALICTNFGAEFGRSEVHQVARHEADEDGDSLPITIGGRGIAAGLELSELNKKISDGWVISRTRLSEDYDCEAYLSARPDAVVIAAVRGGETLEFMQPHKDVTGEAGDVMIALNRPKNAENADHVVKDVEEAETEEEPERSDAKVGKSNGKRKSSENGNG